MKTFLREGQWPILLFTAVYLFLFTILFIVQRNYEFIWYVLVVLFFIGFILLVNRKVVFPRFVLFGLSIWALLHMAGGGIKVAEDQVLYSLVVWPLVPYPYFILKFDQIVHIFGFGLSTFFLYYLLKPSLKKMKNLTFNIYFIILIAAIGLGALNEIVEFLATVFIASTNVGGYYNTALDLVANLIGAIIGVILLYYYTNK